MLNGMSADNPSPTEKRGFRPPLDYGDVVKMLDAQGTDPIVSKPWLCDVTRAHAQLINRYNEDRRSKDLLEEKFLNIAAGPRRLRELLWEDFHWIAREFPPLKNLASQMAFVEVAGASPNAFIFPFRREHEEIYVVAFKSPLIQFINSCFSKMWCLLHTHRHAGCLDELEPEMYSDTYSDASLLAALFNDIEILFDQERLYLPFKPPHIANPYDYCERVDGARRFILAHELMHLFCPLNDASPPDSPAAADMPLAHRIELWCDRAAIGVMMGNYASGPLVGPPLYQLCNDLIGALTFLNLMDVAEAALREQHVLQAEHPPAWIRILNAYAAIQQHPVFQNSETLYSVLKSNKRQLDTFRRFVAGAGSSVASLSPRSSWDFDDFRNRLTPFGFNAFQALMEEAAKRVTGGYASEFNPMARALFHLDAAQALSESSRSFLGHLHPPK